MNAVRNAKAAAVTVLAAGSLLLGTAAVQATAALPKNDFGWQSVTAASLPKNDFGWQTTPAGAPLGDLGRQ
ncbi:hypothetical protein [Streptomyces sp. NPDC012888]|uniref:hypothetical protein n=1 Tax=Streptomyces sp. NPDC012888 TaxID=3364855 RepID=UPI0036CADB52